jgi:archaellum component FlaC
MKKEFIDSLRYDISLLGLRVSNHLSRIDEKIEGIEANLDELSNVYTTQKIDPYIVNVNQPNWLDRTIEDIDKRDLERALEELTPKNVTDGLNRLYTKIDGGRTYLDDVNDKVDQIILERKIRERIIARLEEEAEDSLCSCGDICNAFDNGFNTAIQSIRDL